MPTYEYKGVHYDISDTDPAVAKSKILAHLGVADKDIATEKPKESPPIGDQILRQAGLAARTGLQGFVSPITGAADIVGMGLNLIPGVNIPSTSETFSKGLTELGFPEAKEPIEKGVSAVGEFATGLASVAPGAVGKAISSAPEAVKRGISGVSDIFGTLRGTAAETAKNEATRAARGAMEYGASGHEEASRMGSDVAKGLTEKQAAINAKVADQKNLEVPHLGEQGKLIRNEVKSVTDAAIALRRSKADTEFTNVKAMASKKEAAGGRVNTESVQKSLVDLRDKVSAIPELSSQIDKFIEATKGTRTFDELEYARRYLNDVAYSGPMEGYGSIVKKAALDASHSLDKAMSEFVPEFKKYKDNYIKMSEPLDAMNTRLGKAIHGTEGGLSGDVYSKVEEQDLPTRLFSKAGGFETLTDMLAGGKNATAEAKSVAGKKVDAMVENWLRESIRGKSTTEAAISHITSPQMRATLSEQPAGKKILSQLENTAKAEKSSEELGKFSEKVVSKAKEHAESAAKIRTEISRADSIASGKSYASQKQAFDIYISAIKSGDLNSPQYKAAISLIDRANTLAEKTALARKIAGWVGVGGGIIAEETLRKAI